jgi:hypothetical protein
MMAGCSWSKSQDVADVHGAQTRACRELGLRPHFAAVEHALPGAREREKANDSRRF